MVTQREVKVLIAQLYLAACDPVDYSPLGFSVHGILQARILESESESHSVLSDSLRPHELYSPGNSPGLILEWVAFPSPGYPPNPGIEPRSPALQVDSLPAEP